MRALPMVADWRRCVAALFPDRHRHQTNALADLSFAVALAGDCRAGRVSPHVPTAAHPASGRRRFERVLANPRLRPRQAQRQLARSVVAHWGGRTVPLILDETARSDALRALCVRVGYAGRALPLAWVCYPPHAPPDPLPVLVQSLLRQVRGCLPSGCEVVLLADRGLAWPVLVDFCAASGWHYAVRLQGHTRVRLPDGSERAARELAPRPGARWWGPGEAFKDAGWRGAGVAAVWERGHAQPWVVLADEPGRWRHLRRYADRMWVEESFRDDKGGAFGWGRSQVDDPTHAARLLLLLALATLLGTSVGGRGAKCGRRRQLDPRRRRTGRRRVSLLQMGLRWLRAAVVGGFTHALKLGRLYLHPR
jgi:hypothetical protein